MALALCAASDTASQSLIDAVRTEHGASGFAAAFLHARGLDWAGELLADYPKEENP